MPSMDTVVYWSRVCLYIAAICTTAFPLLYLLSPWYKSKLGRAVMLQSVALAFAINLSVIRVFWDMSNLQILIRNVTILLFISGASLYLTATLWYYNFKSHNKESTQNVEQPPGDAGQAPLSQ